MTRARALARRGVGHTWPNPIVGAVVASASGEEIASGFHRRAGEAHAEKMALDDAGERARGATLVVSLEPCVHHGHTPPCVERVLGAGVVRVVIPALDPDPRVNGRGVKELRSHGIRVDVGCDASSAVLDNLGYYRRRLGMKGTVTLKAAASADGMASRGPGRRDDVTGPEAKRDVHELRALHDAVVVGSETARVDRPLLDCRLVDGGVDRSPMPVVVDTGLRTTDHHWPRFVVATGPQPPPARVRAIEARGGRVVPCRLEDGAVDLADAVVRLAELGLERILVEGGPRLLRAFVRVGAWDAAWWYRSRAVFGEGVPWFAPGFEAEPGVCIDESSVGDDVLRRFVNPATWDAMNRARG